jgi:hypothetical protein
MPRLARDVVKELKALRDENTRLGRLVADQALNIQMLSNVNSNMVSTSQTRHAVRSVVTAGLSSSRQACRYFGSVRSSFTYRNKPPCYGHRRVRTMVLRRGLSRARRTVRRVRRREGVHVLGPARLQRCPPHPEAKIEAEGVNDV